MPKVTCSTHVPAQQSTVANGGTTNACANGQEKDILLALSAAFPNLAQKSRMSIIDDPGLSGAEA